MPSPKIYNIRAWEIKTQPAFANFKGKGNNIVNILPPGFAYGSYLYLRDILFLYQNTYEDLLLVVSENLASSHTGWSFTLARHDTKVGTAFFTDLLLKPKINHGYYLMLPGLPSLPDTYDFWYKIHYRQITLEEFNLIEREAKYFMESRYLSGYTPFAKRHLVQK